MNLETLIHPTDLHDYAKDQGWLLLKEAAKDRLYVMTNPRFERRQLVFPMDTTAPDYNEAVMLIVDKLAAMEGMWVSRATRSMRLRRTLSRHLPPRQSDDGTLPFAGKAFLVAALAGLGYWIHSQPLTATVVSGAFVLLIALPTILERQRTARMRRERKDTICDFRRFFDVRAVDPWIIRATHRAFGAWFDSKEPQFPLRAADSFANDVRIDPEDLDDLAHEVAQRAGYDLSNSERNPLYGKVKTVEDFVMFFTHQPRTRPAHPGVGTGSRAVPSDSK